MVKHPGSAGFLRTGNQLKSTLSSSQRSALIRKGNECFNTGDFETARKIFITTAYSDGIIRLGDYYKKKGDPVEAIKMYQLAPARERLDVMLEETAGVLRRWLKEE